MRSLCALAWLAAASLLGPACVVECHCPERPDAACAMAVDAGEDPADAALLDTDDRAHNPPVLGLVSGTTIHLVLGEPFTDPGSYAVDAEDGDLTGSIVVSGAVDTQRARTYTRLYTVQDSDGNQASIERRVVVHLTNDIVTAAFDVTETCQSTGDHDPYLVLVWPRRDTDDEMTFLNFGGYPTQVDVEAQLTGENLRQLDLPRQIVNGRTFEGAGEFNDEASLGVITYNVEEGVVAEDCTATWVRQ